MTHNVSYHFCNKHVVDQFDYEVLYAAHLHRCQQVLDRHVAVQLQALRQVECRAKTIVRVGSGAGHRAVHVNSKQSMPPVQSEHKP